MNGSGGEREDGEWISVLYACRGPWERGRKGGRRMRLRIGVLQGFNVNVELAALCILYEGGAGGYRRKDFRAVCVSGP